jgi:L-malate glycosyltransferase
MNIAVITTHYPTPDPEEQYTKADHLWALEWVKAGHRVSVFHLRPRLVWKEKSGRGLWEYAIDGIPVIYLDYPRYIPHRGFISSRVSKHAAAAVAGRLEEADPDIVIFDFCAGNWAVIRRLKQRRVLSGKLFVPLFNNCDLNSIRRAKAIARASAVVGARSASIAKKLRELAPDTPLFIALSGAPLTDSARVQEKIRERRTPRKLMFAGNLIPLKNVDVLLEAIGRLKKYALTLCVVGDGPQEASLKARTAALNLQGVKFTGRISRDDVLQKMLDSDIFVMASSPESFGMVYMEAMAAGCYAIGSRGEGIDGVIVDGQNGALVAPRSADELQTALETYILLPQEKRTAILEAAVRTAHEYSDEAVANQILEDIKRLTGMVSGI